MLVGMVDFAPPVLAGAGLFYEKERPYHCAAPVKVCQTKNYSIKRKINRRTDGLLGKDELLLARRLAAILCLACSLRFSCSGVRSVKTEREKLRM